MKHEKTILELIKKDPIFVLRTKEDYKVFKDGTLYLNYDNYVEIIGKEYLEQLKGFLAALKGGKLLLLSKHSHNGIGHFKYLFSKGNRILNCFNILYLMGFKKTRNRAFFIAETGRGIKAGTLSDIMRKMQSFGIINSEQRENLQTFFVPEFDV